MYLPRLFTFCGAWLCFMLLTSGIIVVSAAGGDTLFPGFSGVGANISSALPSEFANLTIPELPALPERNHQVNSGITPDSQILSSQLVTATEIKTLGDAVLVPITPTPEGSGYSYYNPNGTDPSYLIYSSGTYTLGSGFSTANNSAIRIGASDVVLEGNGQTVTGNMTNYGVTINTVGSNVTVRNFAGIKEYYNGIEAYGDQATIINNTIADNYQGGINLTGADGTVAQNFLYNNTEYGVTSIGDNSTVTGNSIHDNNYYGIFSNCGNSTMIGNIVNNNRNGIISTGFNNVVTENTIANNWNYGISLVGDRDIISSNTISNNLFSIYSFASNTTISGNTITSTSSEEGYGIYSIADNGIISGNNANNNLFGVIAIGNNITVVRNNAYRNLLYGIGAEGLNITISDNTIRDTFLYGLLTIGNNSTIQNNVIGNATCGIAIPYNDYGFRITGNIINITTGYGIRFPYFSANGDGLIYNNYFGSAYNVGGEGNFNQGNLIWTNTAGPQRGTNVVGGPFIAGNYWSNATGTGWSDQQPANITGYTTTPYEVVPGMFDTAPLVPQKGVTINSTANDWGIIVPRGNNTYRSYTNQSFITEAKPGADLTDVLVDSGSVGNVSSWTFTELTDNHDIQVIGNATPGQIHVFFNATPRYGEMPLTVSFSSEQSLGTPTSWYWQFGDGTNNTTQNPDHTYTVPGIYTVTLREMNNQTGGYGIWNKYITVTDGAVPEPTPTLVPGEIAVQFSAYPTQGTNPVLVEFTDLSTGNPTSWNWDFGDGSHSTLQNPSHLYTTPGTYSVTLSARNSNGGESLTVPHTIVVQ